MALAYLAYPWLAWSAGDPIHPVTLAIPLFLYCDLVPRRRPAVAGFAPFAVLAVVCGELMGLSVAALGIWYGARARAAEGRRWTIVLIGAAWRVVAVKVVVPAFLDGPSVYYERYTRRSGARRKGSLTTAVTDPSAIASTLFTGSDASS